MIQTTDYVAPDSDIGIEMVPDAFHVMKKSEYSDLFGDYSSYSFEHELLSENIDEEEVDL
jgi:spermidine/putrescine transport system ATP-binding protein